MPYTGRTDDIDIESEPLYCPSCRYEAPLKLNKAKTVLSCMNPAFLSCSGDYCEYKYELTAERQRIGTFWSSGFDYPLAKRDLLEDQLNRARVRLKCIPTLREQAIKTFNEEEQALSSTVDRLKRELSELKQETSRHE